MGCSPPGSFFHGILQARILVWVSMSFFKGSSQPRDRILCLPHCNCILYNWPPRKPQIVCSVQFSSVAQSCPTLCDPVDCSPPGSSFHGILQARILEWVAISISRGLPDPGIEPRPPALQADALTSEPPGKPLWLPEEGWIGSLGLADANSYT